MPRVTGTQTSFNAGELSPLLEGRTDTDAYSRGCRTLKNFLPTSQGAAVKRFGTKYISKVKNSSENQILVEFIFSEIDSYILEFGNNYIRFYQNQSQVQSGGSPFEISTIYSHIDIFDIKFVQINDIIYLVHNKYGTQKLSRFSDTNWTIEAVDNKFGPVLDRNADEQVTMQVTGDITVDGTVTVTASSSSFGTDDLGFQDGHIDSVWAFAEASDSLSPYDEWGAGKTFAANVYVRRDGRLYFTPTGGTTGTFPPVHEDGTVNDGGVDWLFVNFGVGYARMTARTSSTVATFKVQRHLPPTIVTGSPQFQATTYWNEAAWSNVQGFPGSIAVHEERLFLGGTTRSPLSIYGSKSNRRFENFDPAQAEDDAAIKYELSGRINTIQWLKSDGNFLLAGTLGGIAFLGSGNASEPLTPTNVKANTGSSFGANNVQAIELYNTIQYVQKQGKRIYQTQYDDFSLKYKVTDLNIANPGILKSGVVQVATQEEPYVTLWCVNSDGTLTGLVQEDNQNVLAWTRFITGEKGDGTFDKFKSVASIPTEDTDEIWCIVERKVGGTTEKYIEIFEPDDSLNNYVDSGIHYTGTPTNVITGLDHLENDDVAILADGAPMPNRSVSGGQITLDKPASDVFVGLPYNADLSPMLIDGGSANGPAQTKTKRIHEIAMRLYKTLGLKVGHDFNNLVPINFREFQMAMDNPPDLFGYPHPDDKIEEFNGDWGNGNIALRSDQPLPCTVLSISPRYVTNDK